MNAHITKIEEVRPDVLTVTLLVHAPPRPWDPLSDETYPVLARIGEADNERLLATPEEDRNVIWREILKENELPQQGLAPGDIERLEKKRQYYRELRAWEAKMKEYDTLHIGEAEIRQVEE